LELSPKRERWFTKAGIKLHGGDELDRMLTLEPFGKQELSELIFRDRTEEGNE